MEDAILARYSGNSLSAINRCRMHMRWSVKRSDIGLHEINDSALEVRYSAHESNMSSTAYRCPPQPRQPPLKDRQIWHQFLRRTYNISNDNREFNTLDGRWRHSAAIMSPWAFSCEHNALYERVSKRANGGSGRRQNNDNAVKENTN